MASKNYAKEWREWIDNLPNYGILPDVGLKHALIEHRTVNAQDAYRRLGEYMLYLITKGLIDSPPPSTTVVALNNSAYKEHREAKKKSTSKAADLIASALRDDGTIDIDKLVNVFMAGSQKRTVYTSILYNLAALNQEWAAEWREKLPFKV